MNKRHVLNHKIDFVEIVKVQNSNPNGNPLDENRPRTDSVGRGIISDVCIKRKIRNRLQDAGEPIFVQSEDRCDDGYQSLSERAENTIRDYMSKEEYKDKACAEWIDVRGFGQLFAFKAKSAKKKNDKSDEAKESGKGVSVGVRGPISIHQAVSCSPVTINEMQITKSVNGETGEKKSSDTFGKKRFVEFGLYVIKGSINVQLAQKTGFTEEDALKIKEALSTLFENDASSARPEGSMEVLALYWFDHNNKSGQYSTSKVHNSIKIKLKDNVIEPSSEEDYEITVEELPGLKPEIILGD